MLRHMYLWEYPFKRSSKRRSRRHLLGVLLAAALLQILTGCTNTWHEGNLAVPGTYKVPITATDTNNQQPDRESHHCHHALDP